MPSYGHAALVGPEELAELDGERELLADGEQASDRRQRVHDQERVELAALDRPVPGDQLIGRGQDGRRGRGRAGERGHGGERHKDEESSALHRDLDSRSRRPFLPHRYPPDPPAKRKK
jgi:hypothetical protein